MKESNSGLLQLDKVTLKRIDRNQIIPRWIATSWRQSNLTPLHMAAGEPQGRAARRGGPWAFACHRMGGDGRRVFDRLGVLSAIGIFSQ